MCRREDLLDLMQKGEELACNGVILFGCEIGEQTAMKIAEQLPYRSKTRMKTEIWKYSLKSIRLVKKGVSGNKK